LSYHKPIKLSCPFAITSLISCEITKAEMTHFLTSLVVCKHTVY